MEHRWITPVIVTVSVLAGAAIYLARPAFSHTDARRSHAAATSQGSQSLSGTAAGQCFAAGDPSVTRASIQEKYRWAHTLVDQKLYDAALPELRFIAAKDPGYPGINLDISDALLQLKQPQAAQDAINQQNAVSECISKLSSDALDTYCSVEMPDATSDGCRAQLGYIGKATDLQAALVRLDSPHEPGADSSPAKEVATTGRPHVTRARAEPERPAAQHSTAPHRSSADRSLIDGDGTDASLGAYSKPR